MLKYADDVSLSAAGCACIHHITHVQQRLTGFVPSGREPPRSRTLELWVWPFWHARWRAVFPAWRRKIVWRYRNVFDAAGKINVLEQIHSPLNQNCIHSWGDKRFQRLIKMFIRHKIKSTQEVSKLFTVILGVKTFFFPKVPTAFFSWKLSFMCPHVTSLCNLENCQTV